MMGRFGSEKRKKIVKKPKKRYQNQEIPDTLIIKLADLVHVNLENMYNPGRKGK